MTLLSDFKTKQPKPKKKNIHSKMEMKYFLIFILTVQNIGYSVFLRMVDKPECLWFLSKNGSKES